MATLHAVELAHLCNKVALVQATHINHVSELVVVFGHLHIVPHVDVVHRGVCVAHNVLHILWVLLVGQPLLRRGLVHVVHSH